MRDPGYRLGEGEIELCPGIHREQGVRRAKFTGADAPVDSLLDVILDDRGIVQGDQVVLLVNGLGGTPTMELAVVAPRAPAPLQARGIVVARAWSGTLPSALECRSLSLMRVDASMLALLDVAATAAAWPGGCIPDARMIRPVDTGALLAAERNRSGDHMGARQSSTRR